MSLARRAVRWAVRSVLSSSRLSELARGVLASHPALKARLRQVTVNADVAERSAAPAAAAGGLPFPEQLSERAGRLYMDMRKDATRKEH